MDADGVSGMTSFPKAPKYCLTRYESERNDRVLKKLSELEQEVIELKIRVSDLEGKIIGKNRPGFRWQKKEKSAT